MKSHEAPKVIVKHLSALLKDLDGFEQTTHSRMSLGDGIGAVAEDLKGVYYDPSAYTISNLAQSIEQLIKRDPSIVATIATADVPGPWGDIEAKAGSVQ